MSLPYRLHCINSYCPSPYPQPGHNKFCQSCGTPLRLNGRYLPLQRLGMGGFASIYTVWDWQNQRERVLKVLTVTSKKALQLFEQEASVLASLSHRGVPQVEPHSFFQVPTHQQQPIYCLVMEKIVGRTLEDILIRSYPQGCPEALIIDWLGQATEILDVLHCCQIVHRDIKPSNLMLRGFRQPDPVSGGSNGGQLVLIDFGGAKQKDVTDSSTRLFSSGYSPPEQISGRLVEPTADIYALGRTAIHLLTGKHPIELEDIHTEELEWRQHARVSPALANLLDATIRPQAGDRPQSARELQRRLLQLSRGTFSPTQVVPQIAQQTRQKARQGFLLASVLLARSLKLGVRGMNWAIAAAFDTTQEMWGGAMGAVLGAIAGFVLAHWTPLGGLLASLVTAYLPSVLSGVEVDVGQEILLFACVGLGTGWGLAKAGGFGQRVQTFSAGLTGFLGYSLGWLLWQGMPYSATIRFFAFVVVATAILPLGLGLPSHLLAHAFIAAIGTTALFSFSILQGRLSDEPIEAILSFARFDVSLGFCALLGLGVALSLGVSYYIFVPILRWLDR